MCIHCVGVAAAHEMHIIAKQVNTCLMLRAFSRNANYQVGETCWKTVMSFALTVQSPSIKPLGSLRTDH